MSIHCRLSCLLLISLAAGATVAAADDLDNVRLVAARLSDIAAAAETRDVNADEFAKLKKSAQVLQFKRLQFYYKLPDKLRVDSRGRELIHVSVIQNGGRKTFRTSLGLRRTQDISD